MSKIATAIKLLKYNRGEFFASILMYLNFLFPDKLYLTLLFRCKMGYWIDWKNPKTFSEKLQWLKLYDRKPEYTTMVDKYAVKEYVAKIIGEEYIIPTLGVWDKPEDIDWDSLPQKFVLKTTHGGGGSGVVICKDKDTFNKTDAIEKLKKSLSKCIYKSFREWPYKNVNKKIIAEVYLEESNLTTNSTDVSDYKLYCFNGEPKIILVAEGRYSGNLCFDYYDMQWNKIPLVWGAPNSDINHKCPRCFEEMKNLCMKLSKDISHVSCDFYIINNKPLFGELTFYDASGYVNSSYSDNSWDYKLGAILELPLK